MRNYKGYSLRIEYDDDELLFHGEVTGIRDVITFQAHSAEELNKTFRESVDDYLDFCAKDGVDPQKPFSGTLSLRMLPELHQRIAEAASHRNISINQWIIDVLKNKAENDLNGTIKVR